VGGSSRNERRSQNQEVNTLANEQSRGGGHGAKKKVMTFGPSGPPFQECRTNFEGICNLGDEKTVRGEGAEGGRGRGCLKEKTADTRFGR